jgi:hypothetical protein
MRLLIRLVAILAALSVLGTVWFIAAFAGAGGLRALVSGGLLGVLTLVGWAIALVAGPVAAVQLWRFRQSGRHAGIILYGYGLAYYLIGLFGLRSPEASIPDIFAAAMMYTLPLVVLLLPRTRTLFATGTSDAAR